MQRAYAATAVGQVHYRQSGEGRPLVLLHQSPSSSAMWEPVLDRFAARGYLALAPDLLGHGLTDPAASRPDLAAYAAGVWAFLDTLRLERVDLLGHHSGANIAVLMAAEQPARVRALALWGVALLPAERMAGPAGEAAPDWEHADAWLGPRWDRRRAASGHAWTPDLGRRALLELLQSGPNAQWLHNAVGEHPIDAYLPRLELPVLTIGGELDSLFAASEDAARRIPNARFHPMYNTSLDVADQFPDQLVEVVDAFLSRSVDTTSGGG
jgi:pimeloyl-ACP methyl ester carboxylesterase